MVENKTSLGRVDLFLLFQSMRLLSSKFFQKLPFMQERREKFRASGQKFRLGPLVSGTPKSRDEQKKVIASADVRISPQNQVMSKKRVIASADVQISAQHLVMSKLRS